MRRRIGLLLTLAVWLGLAIPAHADLQLRFTNDTTTPGGTATIDVFVSDPSGNGIDIFGYNFDFRIEKISGPGDLQFVDPQDLGYRNDSDYVLGPNSYNDRSVVESFHKYDGAATTEFLDDVTVNGEKLLARLQFLATPYAGLSDSKFVVSYMHADGENDYEGNSDFGNFAFDADNGFGTITVQAVPEPAAVVSVLTGLALVLVGHGWRCRRDRRANVHAGT